MPDSLPCRIRPRQGGAGAPGSARTREEPAAGDAHPGGRASALRLSERTALLLYGTPLRRRRFLGLLERLPQEPLRALWRGVLAGDGELLVDVVATTPCAALDELNASTVATIRGLLPADPVLPPKATGFCQRCGKELPLDPERAKRGGRPPLYCPGPGCAPCRTR